MDSDRESDDCEYESGQHRVSERRIEQQLDDFRAKWTSEIQQRTVYGHILNDKQSKQEEETINKEEQAKNFFERAAELERDGKLYDAIKFYRAAMQLVPDIEFRMARRTQQQPAASNSITTSEVSSRENEEREDVGGEDNATRESGGLVDSLQRLNVDDGAICAKNFPQKATHISSLPSEVLIYILRWVVSSELDVRSLEQCARVCRGFYVCARDSQLWKLICFKTWSINTVNQLSTNWRHMFITRPHVVFNGVYISRASYIRQGEQSLDTFYSPWHLVEYYRYIRFFPDGFVLICTTADEPRATVGRLKSRLTNRDPVIVHGNYRLQNNRVIIVAKHAAHRTPIMSSTNRRGAREMPISEIEQTMHMEFEMCDAGKKKHQQLVWVHYEMKFSNKRTSEERSTVLNAATDRHAYPSLIFSRVKSYLQAAEQPLK